MIPPGNIKKPIQIPIPSQMPIPEDKIPIQEDKIPIPTSHRLDDKFRLSGKVIAREGDLARGVWHYAQVRKTL